MTPSSIISSGRGEERPSAGPRNPGRPTLHAAAALPDRILDAAQDLFLTQGFEATSLNQIAAGAGVTKRTLYVKVGDKSEIFAAAVRRMLDRRRERLDDANTANSLTERLVSFGEGLLTVVLDPDVLRLYRVLVAEAPRFPALATLMEEQTAHGVHRRLVELLRDETRRGRFPPTDPGMAAQFFLSMIIWSPQRSVLFGLQPWDPAHRSRWVRAAVRLFLEGCQPLDDHIG